MEQVDQNCFVEEIRSLLRSGSVSRVGEKPACLLFVDISIVHFISC